MATYIKKGYGFHVGADFARAPHGILFTPDDPASDGQSLRGTIDGLDDPKIPVIGRKGKLGVYVSKSALEQK